MASIQVVSTPYYTGGAWLSYLNSTITVRDGLWVEIDVWEQFNNFRDYFNINGVKNNLGYAGPDSSQ
jgi:hypothetical protein